MKIVGVSMVRNEADIVETFVRHNLSLLDGLIVIDHGSADATREILTALTRERLPLVVLANEDPRFVQAQVLTEVARSLFVQRSADVVLPLDADEFVKAPSRAELERVLGGIAPGAHGQLHWQNYVPDFARPRSGLRATIAASKRATVEIHGLYKVAVTRAFMDAPDSVLTEGLHFVAPRPGAGVDDLGVHTRLPATSVAIAHLPLRTAEQFVVKVAVKKLGRIGAANDWTADAAMQSAYTRLREGASSDPATMRLAAANWSVPVGRWVDPDTRTWIDDPFLAAFPLRFTPPRTDAALPLVLAAVERLARRAASNRSGVTGVA